MNEKIAKVLLESRIFRDYTKAFREMTGTLLFLRPIQAGLLPSAGEGRRRWSCAVLGRPSCGCKSCARGFERIASGMASRKESIKCKCGCGVAVPVKSGKDLIALLHVDSSGAGSPSSVRFSPRQFGAALKLLGIFAQQLGGLCNQMLVQKENGEPPLIGRAKEFISQHHGEDISSRQVARELHVSRYYFCKQFKKSTGLTFTEYVSRMRVERVKELLLNRNLRVSEIAFQTGFQSLTHFNRLFLKFTGESPTGYRRRLHAI